MIQQESAAQIEKLTREVQQLKKEDNDGILDSLCNDSGSPSVKAEFEVKEELEASQCDGETAPSAEKEPRESTMLSMKKEKEQQTGQLEMEQDAPATREKLEPAGSPLPAKPHMVSKRVENKMDAEAMFWKWQHEKLKHRYVNDKGEYRYVCAACGSDMKMQNKRHDRFLKHLADHCPERSLASGSGINMASDTREQLQISRFFAVKPRVKQEDCFGESDEDNTAKGADRTAARQEQPELRTRNCMGVYCFDIWKHLHFADDLQDLMRSPQEPGHDSN